MQPLTIVIPAFNEEATVSDTVRQIRALCNDLVECIIVVDDGSTDSTGDAAGAAGAYVIRHGMNRGYGAALKTGIRAAKTEFVLTMDSDGQHRAEDVSTLWNAVQESDMVIGQRTALIHSPVWRMPGKWLLSLMANYIARFRIPDLNSGMRLMRREVVLKYLHLCPSGFSFSTTITMALLNRGYRLTYIPITVQRRVGKSSVSIATGIDTLILILRIAVLFDPLRIFIPISSAAVLIGTLWAIPYALQGRGISVGSMLAIVTGINLFAVGLLCDQISQLRLEKYE